MEGVPMVSYSRESMNSLLHKLTKLKTRNIQSLPRAHVESLLQALTGLNGDFLDKVAGRQERDRRVKEWMMQVRQLVVDIDDWVDSKLLNMQELENENFEDLMAQIRKACGRCKRYGLLEASTDPAVPVDVVVPRQLLLEEKPVGLVGLDGPIQELVGKLTDGKRSLKVVSIVGTEGRGKTTLAKEIYAKLQGKFDRQAFVSVSRRASVSAILVDILRQVKLEASRNTRVESQDMQAIINDLRECLGINSGPNRRQRRWRPKDAAATPDFLLKQPNRLRRPPTERAQRAALN